MFLQKLFFLFILIYGLLLPFQGYAEKQRLKVLDISAKEHSLCAVGEDYQLRCWGDAHVYFIGDAPLGKMKVKQVSVGTRNICVIRLSQEVYCEGVTIPKGLKALAIASVHSHDW